MYESIKAWLDGGENPEEYDFREEIVEFASELDVVDRYYTYKALGIKVTKGPEHLAYREAVERCESGLPHVHDAKGEADTCRLVQEIYQKLWDEKYLSYCLDSGDTMNSANTTIAEVLKRSADQLEMNDACRKARWNANQKSLWLYYYNKKGVKRLLTSAKQFLKVAYAIGNFIPCPAGCNGPRGAGPTKDYWDLALLAIYQYFTENREEGIKKMLKKQEKETRRYIAWLNTFGGWDQFVVANYMQDFVKPAGSANNGVFGEPKELWGEHFGGPVEPAPEQIEEFFTRAAQCIEARSKRMVEALRDSKEEN